MIVLYVHGNTLESRMKATGSDFRLNSSIRSLVEKHLVFSKKNY